MSVTLKIDNYNSINVKERTTLVADLPVGSTSLTLANNNNIIAGDNILLGSPGSETAEIRTVASATGATIVTTDATTLYHNRYERVTALIGTKLKIYKAPNVNGNQPADGTFVHWQTFDIDPDQLSTSITDPTGSSDYWYKFTYYNSVSLAETSLADSAAVRGGTIGQYATLDSIRQLAGFANNFNIADSLVDEKRQAAQAQINGALAGLYTIPFAAPVNPLISEITRFLAAGHLQIDQYGSYTTTDTKNGQLKIDWAEAKLELLKSGQLELTEPGGGTTPTTSTSGGFSGYPNSTAPTSEDFMFKRDYIDGYETRHY